MCSADTCVIRDLETNKTLTNEFKGWGKQILLVFCPASVGDMYRI